MSPARSITDVPDATAPILRRIMRDHLIRRVELRCSPGIVVATAIPEAMHPAVAERRDAAIRAKGGSITLEEATAIQEDAAGSVALGRGPTPVEALRVLELALRAAAVPA